MSSISKEQVTQHTSEKDCWIIVHNRVYDVSQFLDEHPGGKKILLKAAGTDASKQFDAFHNQAILEKYAHLAIGEVSTSPAPTTKAPRETPAEEEGEATFGEMNPFGDPSWYQDGIESPFYKESHRKLRKAVREFTEKEITPYCHEWDEARQVPRQLFVKAAELNILAACLGVLPKKWMRNKMIMGCVPLDEFDAFHEFVLSDEMARCGSGGVMWGLFGGFSIGLPPLIHFAAPKLQERVIPDCIEGKKTICLAITEPSAGSDVANLKCEARETADGEHYIVNGEKKWITNGVFADYFTVAVRTGGEGAGGISLLLIERGMPGITTRQMKCSGVWSSGTTYITFEDVKVPKDNLIGEENQGFKYIMYNFNHERLSGVIGANRLARVCLEESLKYAHKRRTFGQRLIDHQVIRFKLAAMARRVESTHAWLEQLIYRSTKMSHQEAMIKLGGPIALLKVQATQTFEFCAREAAQIFGGLSYTRGGQGEKVERLYREVRAYAIPAGSEEIMEELGIKQAIKWAKLSGAKL